MSQLQNGNYQGYLVGAGVGEAKEGGKPYFFSSWELRYFWENSAWVTLPEPYPTRDIMWSLNPDVGQNSKSGRPAMEFTLERLQKVGFNGNWDDPKFSQEYYDAGTIIVASESSREYKGQKQQQFDLEMFAKGNGIEHKAASQTTKMSVKAYWNKFNTTNKLPSKLMTAQPAPSPVAATLVPTPSVPSASQPSASPPATEEPKPATPLTTATREQAWAVFVNVNNSSISPLNAEQLTAEWRKAIQERFNKPELQITSEEWADLSNNVEQYFPPF